MWGEEARLWGMPWSMHCPGQEWVEQGQARKIKGAGVMTAATSLTTFSVPIRPGPLLPGVQAGLPGRLWRDRWDASILAPDLGSRYLPGCSPRQQH